MLPAAMRRALTYALALGLLVIGLALASCGEESGGTEGNEGEPVVLGDVSYNVGLTRFLNPDDTEDREYLVGQPPAPDGTYYLGVFIVVSNESDESKPTAGDYTVVDTLDNKYRPLSSDSPFALRIGTPVEPDGQLEGQLPVLDSTAQTGPNQGALLIFRVNDDVSDNRPLMLEIGSDAGDGEILLDI
jgi:hypothetical protein